MSTDFDRLKSQLTLGQDPRLWSLLVTVFGDLAPNHDDWISGMILNRITAAIDLKPEATRVALHRLRKDSWIESRRTGRRSDYRLTETGRRETEAAGPRIYATSGVDLPCRLLIAEPGTQAATADPHTVWLSADLALSTVRFVTDGITPCALPDRLPDWMRERLVDPRLEPVLIETERSFRALKTALAQPCDITQFQRTVLRLLVVHNWRRIALRMPLLPDAVFPKDWAGPQCRVLAAALLKQLSKPDLTDLDDPVVLSSG